MSRIGKLPIKVPDNIKVQVNGSLVSFDSGKVKRDYELSPKDKNIAGSSMHTGKDRSNINSIVHGLKEPFKVVLEINGVGYKAAVHGHSLTLTLGYSHDIIYVLPSNIKAVIEKQTLITLSGEDKVLVGQIAAEIISFRKPEPYKGKGVKIFGKKILRKEGKKK
jgi:large subunit ribosomal protein L6